MLAPSQFCDTICSALQPDFILIRQDPRDAGEDYKSVILGLQYGQLLSINSLQSIYNFQVGYPVGLKFECRYFPGQAMGLCTLAGTAEKTGQRELPIDRANVLPKPSRYSEYFHLFMSTIHKNQNQHLNLCNVFSKFLTVQVHKGDYPCVFKIGHAHGGLGKMKVDTAEAFKDLAGVVAVSAQYCTVEQYVDTYCDLHIYKIGTKYKSLM